MRVEAVLDRLKGAHEARAEHRLVELGAQIAVAVLARMRALVLAHEGEGLLRDGAHRAHVLLQLEVEHGAHMQAALGGVRVPGAGGAVLGEDGRQPLRVGGEMG